MSQRDPIYKEAIKKTMIYSGIFKYPLTYHQLLNYLIIEPQDKINIKSFEYELAKLIKKQYVKVDEERCYLPGIKYIDWKERKKTTKYLLRKNKHIFKLLETIPWIKFIGITGSVAAYNADSDADIDVFVITEKNRVWITRGIFTILLKVILKNYVKKGIDPNIFIDETALEWPKEQQNIYTANEIVRMVPITNKGNTYFKFIQNNKWVKNYLGNFRYYKEKLEEEKKDEKEGLKYFDKLDTLAMKLQLLYMRKKQTKEITKKHFIHFNKNDSTNPIIEKYKEKIKDITEITQP